MKLIEASRAGRRLIVTLPDGAQRLAVEVFAHKDGVLFVDAGWPDATGHPFHVIEGTLTGDGPWQIGGAVFSEVTEDSTLEQIMDWISWEKYRATAAGRAFDRVAAYNNAVRDFPDIIP